MKIEVTNFKNLNSEYDLDGVTVLLGGNGKGKSSLLEAVYIALTGTRPGDRPGGKLYRRLAGPAGKEWSVMLSMGDGTDIVRAWSGAKMTVRMTGAEGANDDHHIAIKEKYPVPQFVDVRGLMKMNQAELGASLVEMCASQVDDDLVGTLVKLEVDYKAADKKVLMSELNLTAGTGSSLEVLDALIADSTAKGVECSASSRDKTKELVGLRERLAEMRAKFVAMPVVAVSSSVEELTKMRDEKKADAEAALVKLKEAEAHNEQAARDQAKIDAAKKEIDGLNGKRNLAINRIVVFNAALDGLDHLPEETVSKPVQAALAADVKRLALSEPDLSAHEGALEVEKEASTREWKNLATLRAYLSAAEEEKNALQRIFDQLSGGNCPLCGSEVDGDGLTIIGSKVAQAVKRIASLTEEEETTVAAIKKKDADVIKINEEITAIKTAFTEKKSLAITERQDLFARLKGEWEASEELAANHKRLGIDISFAEDEEKEISVNTIAASGELRRLSNEMLHPVPRDFDNADVEATASALDEAQKQLDAASEGSDDAAALNAERDSLVLNTDALFSSRRRKKDLVGAHKLFTAVAEAVRAEVLSSKIAPLAAEFSKRFGDSHGRLSLTGDGVCLHKDEGVMVQLRDTSEGERLRIALTLISHIKDGNAGLLMLDNAEAIDEVGETEMIGMMHDMVAGGAFKAVIVASSWWRASTLRSDIKFRVTIMPDGFPF